MGTVTVRYFASLVDAVGAASETVEIEPTASVTDLWGVLIRRHPALRELAFRPLVACDMTYASWERELHGVDEVAFLPPVSGG